MKAFQRQLSIIERQRLYCNKHSQLSICQFSTTPNNRKPRNPQKELLMNIVKLSPHLILGGLFIVSSNMHLLPIPMTTGLLQWMYMKRHLQNMTLYYDLYKLGNNQNHAATYGHSVFQREEQLEKIDEKRTRYSYECSFRDLAKNSEGNIYALIIFTDKSEAYFESFTINLTQPVERTIRVEESDFNEDDKELSSLTGHRKVYDEVKPKERPKSNFRQY